jgi:hypothetical protein
LFHIVIGRLLVSEILNDVFFDVHESLLQHVHFLFVLFEQFNLGIFGPFSILITDFGQNINILDVLFEFALQRRDGFVICRMEHLVELVVSVLVVLYSTGWIEDSIYVDFIENALVGNQFL